MADVTNEEETRYPAPQAASSFLPATHLLICLRHWPGYSWVLDSQCILVFQTPIVFRLLMGSVYIRITKRTYTLNMVQLYCILYPCHLKMIMTNHDLENLIPSIYSHFYKYKFWIFVTFVYHFLLAIFLYLRHFNSPTFRANSLLVLMRKARIVWSTPLGCFANWHLIERFYLKRV